MKEFSPHLFSLSCLKHEETAAGIIMWIKFRKLIERQSLEAVEVSISSTFYEQLFHTKVFFEAFLSLQLRFVFFWRTENGAKAALKMLVKLTRGRRRRRVMRTYQVLLQISFSQLSSLVTQTREMTTTSCRKTS